ncbi:hypothetical protein ColKHC_03017 [Colletotrichum higginsianum]|nr:hypothetical protein ColKHC_03017 [Colletotrichum higginsianum]
MVKPANFLPPDPRPWKAEPESRKQRKEFEKEAGGFDWGQALALGLIGATVVFGIDKSLRRTEENRSQAAWERDRDRDSGLDRDDRSFRDGQSDREYYDRDWDESEYKSVRDYGPPGSEASEPRVRMREGSVRDEREYARAVDPFERNYGYGRRYDEHKRSRSNPASRSRDYW